MLGVVARDALVLPILESRLESALHIQLQSSAKDSD